MSGQPAVSRRIDSKSYQNNLYGPFGTWAEAQAEAVGWDSSQIFEITRQAAQKVRDGYAAYERDGTTFPELEHAWTVAASLLYCAVSKKNGELNVVDYGGALGTSYYQNKRLLRGIRTVNWSIIEQERYCEIGAAEFETGNLKFYRNLNEVLDKYPPDVILLSGVLQYIDDPYGLIDAIVSAGVRFVIIDRTSISNEESDRFYVQDVPAHMYHGSYAMRVFGHRNLMERFESRYELVAEFDKHLFRAYPEYRMFGCHFELRR